MEEARIILALVLSVAVFIVWFLYFTPKQVEKTDEKGVAVFENLSDGNYQVAVVHKRKTAVNLLDTLREEVTKVTFRMF